LQKLIIFDLDKTLVSTNMSYRFGRFLYMHGELPLIKMPWLFLVYFLQHIRILPLGLAYKASFYLLFYKKNVTQYERFVEQFLDEELAASLRPQVYLKLLEAQSQGDRVAIFSTSAHFLVAPVGKRCHIDTIVATRYSEGPDGCFAKVATIVTGEEKKEALFRLRTSPSGEALYSVAYSDSVRDLPLLTAVDEAFLVCPGVVLRCIAWWKKWGVLHG
jgi:HAD superfamily phosphoserine phosphatase-like hydrolase